MNYLNNLELKENEVWREFQPRSFPPDLKLLFSVSQIQFPKLKRGSLTRDRFERRLFDRFNTSRFAKSAAKFERDEPGKVVKIVKNFNLKISFNLDG